VGGGICRDEAAPEERVVFSFNIVIGVSLLYAAVFGDEGLSEIGKFVT